MGVKQAVRFGVFGWHFPFRAPNQQPRAKVLSISFDGHWPSTAQVCDVRWQVWPMATVRYHCTMTAVLGK